MDARHLFSPPSRRGVSFAVGLLALSACGPAPGAITFVAFEPAAQPMIGDEVAVLFHVEDAKGATAAGLGVDLSLEPATAGVTLASTHVATNETGLVRARVRSTVAGAPVVVVAKGGSATAKSTPISFLATRPNARGLSLWCHDEAGSSPRHAIRAFDEARAVVGGVELPCTAAVMDRTGRPVPGVQLSFFSEAGSFAASAEPSTGADGKTLVMHRSGLPLPLDVEPGVFTASPLNDATHIGQLLAPPWMKPTSWNGNPGPPLAPKALGEPVRSDPLRMTPMARPVMNNPRDNLVALIAVAGGEEGFTDTNSNGAYDRGEPFDDTTEPFVDANDDGTWNAGEIFVDSNGDGVWNGKNSQWDAVTLIWAQERVLWTGLPAAKDMKTPSLTAGVLPLATNAMLCCPPQCGPPGGTRCDQAIDPNTYAPYVDFAVLVTDPWYNALAQNAAGDGCTMSVGANSAVTLSAPAFVAGPRTDAPSAEVLSVRVSEARNPSASMNPPKRFPPIGFSFPIICVTTSSPTNGTTATVTIQGPTGTCE